MNGYRAAITVQAQPRPVEASSVPASGSGSAPSGVGEMSLIDHLSSDVDSPPLLALLIAAALAVGLFWGQNRLSKSRHRWLGGILPALFLGFAITMLVAFPDARTVGFALQFGFGLLVLLVIWWLGTDDVPIAPEDTPPPGPEA